MTRQVMENPPKPPVGTSFRPRSSKNCLIMETMRGIAGNSDFQHWKVSLARRPLSLSKDKSTLKPVSLSTNFRMGTLACAIVSIELGTAMSRPLRKAANAYIWPFRCPKVFVPVRMKFVERRTRSISAVGRYSPLAKEPNGLSCAP